MARKKKEESGSNWMDTYGDMVTLLLCFFVMLYSMSSIDQQKWEIIVKSLNPKAEEMAQLMAAQNPASGEPGVTGEISSPGEIIHNIELEQENLDEFDTLYWTLLEAVKQQNLESEVEVTKGDGFTFISFKDNIFFDGDSYILKDKGKEVLNLFASVLAVANDSIAEIQIMGHTSQASPTTPNNIWNDRFLASNRATVVLVYLQQMNLFDPAKMVSSGYGQFRPIASFDSSDNRAKNRRVEVLVTKNDSVVRSLEDYYSEIYK